MMFLRKFIGIVSLVSVLMIQSAQCHGMERVWGLWNCVPSARGLWRHYVTGQQPTATLPQVRQADPVAQLPDDTLAGKVEIMQAIIEVALNDLYNEMTDAIIILASTSRGERLKEDFAQTKKRLIKAAVRKIPRLALGSVTVGDILLECKEPLKEKLISVAYEIKEMIVEELARNAAAGRSGAGDQRSDEDVALLVEEAIESIDEAVADEDADAQAASEEEEEEEENVARTRKKRIGKTTVQRSEPSESEEEEREEEEPVARGLRRSKRRRKVTQD